MMPANDVPQFGCSSQSTGVPSRRRMRSKTYVSVLTAVASVFALLSVAASWAQERTTGPIPNTVLIGADGKFEADPDTVLVQFNISAQDENLQTANDRARQAADQVRELLRKNGIDPKQAQVGQFVVQPVYDYKT